MGKISLTERFMKGFIEVNECWEWIKALNGPGYGVIVDENRIQRSAHRVSWEIYNGKIDAGKFVLHKCDNRKCVRPDHLYLGTQSQNMLDMYKKGRDHLARGENHRWSKLSKTDVLEIRKSYIPRICSWGKLAKKYNVSRSTIQKITNGRNWKSIFDEHL